MSDATRPIADWIPGSREWEASHKAGIRYHETHSDEDAQRYAEARERYAEVCAGIMHDHAALQELVARFRGERR
jgi:hypothetical protein